MLVILGESASGKSSVAQEITKSYNMKKIVSYTTRMARKQEVDGIDYHFISKEKFYEMNNSHCFVETAEYAGWYYGTQKKDCTDDKIHVVTPKCLRELKKYKDLNIVSFYLKVPRRDRLIKSLQRGDDIEEAYRRNISDVGMFDGLENEVDYVIYNTNYKKEVNEIAKDIVDIYYSHINK